MARNPKKLREYLIQHQEHHMATYYYVIRVNVPNDAIECAARFLYLNRIEHDLRGYLLCQPLRRI